ncbi:MAG: hypothetical protein H7221_04970 [Flavobacterium sp.]|nr:hypothetical protein [Flavobacterium sp.]
MLKKSHTKFSYLRKISALPVIFLLAFAYLVNAKNREISKTNEVIAKAVSEIKKDTIKRDTIYAKVQSVNDDKSVPNTFDKIKLADDRSLFIIRGEEVSKKEFLEFLKKNDGNQKMAISSSIGENEMLKKNFGVVGPYGKFEKYGVFTVDFLGDNNAEKYWKIQDKYYPQWRKYTKSLEKPEVRAKLNRLMKVEDQKMIENKDGKKREVYYATATYKEDTVKQYTHTFIVPGLLNGSNQDINKPFKTAVETSTDLNQFFIHDKKVSKIEYQNYFKKNFGDKKYSFGSGVSAMDTNNPVKFFYVNNTENLVTKNAALKAKLLEKTNFVTETEKVKTENQNLDKTVATENPNSSVKSKLNNPWILKVDTIKKDEVKKVDNGYVIGVKSIQKPISLNDPSNKFYLNGKLMDATIVKTVNPNEIKSVNVVKNPGEKDGASVYIITKGERSGPNPILYNKIFINGKLSTQSELDKINKDSIKTQNINKNTENGKSFNEIRIITK